jgi:hypothetical protein
VTQAIAAAFAGKDSRPAFWSYFFQDMTVDPLHERTDRPFPYDVKFLSEAELQHIERIAVNHAHEAWPPERIAAYRGKDLIAKRAAVSAFLWQRYTEYSELSMNTLKLWHEVEQLEKVLRVPFWFRQQHLSEGDIVKAWKDRIGAQYEAAEAKHRAVLKQIQAIV